MVKRRTKIDLLILALVLLLGLIAIPRATAIGDWWHLRNYRPPPEVAQLADQAGMNQLGRRLFYRFSPQLVDEDTMTRQCKTVRLGCTEGRNIYILEPCRPAEQQRAAVTAAHEMLHVAYERLPAAEAERLNDLIDNYLQGRGGALKVKLETYATADYHNEAHSFIGSEAANIGAALEAHYNRYFGDRQLSVRAYLTSPEGR